MDTDTNEDSLTGNDRKVGCADDMDIEHNREVNDLNNTNPHKLSNLESPSSPTDDNFEIVDYAAVSPLDQFVIQLESILTGALSNLKTFEIDKTLNIPNCNKSDINLENKDNILDSDSILQDSSSIDYINHNLNDVFVREYMPFHEKLRKEIKNSYKSTVDLNDITHKLPFCSIPIFNSNFSFENIHYSLELRVLKSDKIKAAKLPGQFPCFVDFSNIKKCLNDTPNNNIYNRLNPQASKSTSSLGLTASKYASYFTGALHAFTDVESKSASSMKYDNHGSEISYFNNTNDIASESSSSTNEIHSQPEFNISPNDMLDQSTTLTLLSYSSNGSKYANNSQTNNFHLYSDAIANVTSLASYLHFVADLNAFFIVTPIGDEQQSYQQKNNVWSKNAHIYGQKVGNSPLKSSKNSLSPISISTDSDSNGTSVLSSALVSAFQKAFKLCGCEIPVFFPSVYHDRIMYFNGFSLKDKLEISNDSNVHLFKMSNMNVNTDGFYSVRELQSIVDESNIINSRTSKTIAYSMKNKETVTNGVDVDNYDNLELRIPWGSTCELIDEIITIIKFPLRESEFFSSIEQGFVVPLPTYKICKNGKKRVVGFNFVSVDEKMDKDSSLVKQRAYNQLYPLIAEFNSKVFMATKVKWKNLDRYLQINNCSTNAKDTYHEKNVYSKNDIRNRLTTEEIKKNTPLISRLMYSILDSLESYRKDIIFLKENGMICDNIDLKLAENSSNEEILDEHRTNNTLLHMPVVKSYQDGLHQTFRSKSVDISREALRDSAPSPEQNTLDEKNLSELTLSSMVGETLEVLKNKSLLSVGDAILGRQTKTPDMVLQGRYMSFVDIDDIKDAVSYIFDSSAMKHDSYVFDNIIEWDIGFPEDSLLYRLVEYIIVAISSEGFVRHKCSLVPLFRGIWADIIIKLEEYYKNNDAVPNVSVAGLNDQLLYDLSDVCKQQPTIDPKHILAYQKLQMLNICILEKKKRKMLENFAKVPTEKFSRKHDQPMCNTAFHEYNQSVSTKKRTNSNRLSDSAMSFTEGNAGVSSRESKSLNSEPLDCFGRPTLVSTKSNNTQISDETLEKSNSFKGLYKQNSLISLSSSQSSKYHQGFSANNDSSLYQNAANTGVNGNVSRSAYSGNSVEPQSWSSDKSWQDIPGSKPLDSIHNSLNSLTKFSGPSSCNKLQARNIHIEYQTDKSAIPNKVRKESFGSIGENRKDIELTAHDMFNYGSDDVDYDLANSTSRRFASGKSYEGYGRTRDESADAKNNEFYSSSLEMKKISTDVKNISLSSDSPNDSTLHTGVNSLKQRRSEEWNNWNSYNVSPNDLKSKDRNNAFSSDEAINISVAVPSTLVGLTNDLSPLFATPKIHSSFIETSDKPSSLDESRQFKFRNELNSNSPYKSINKIKSPRNGKPLPEYGRSSNISIKSNKTVSGTESESVGISSSFVELPLPTPNIHVPRKKDMSVNKGISESYAVSLLSNSPYLSNGSFGNNKSNLSGAFDKTNMFSTESKDKSIFNNQKNENFKEKAKPVSGLTRELISAKSRQDIPITDGVKSKKKCCKCSDCKLPEETPNGLREGGLHELEFPMYTTKEPLYKPITQNSKPMTEDMVHLMRLQMEMMTAEERLESQGKHLKSDMEAFKAANYGCTLIDFVRWHSPRDYCGNGILSTRMQTGLWPEMWESARRVPISRQKPLWDCDLEAERALQWLKRNVHVFDLVPAMLSICYKRLGQGLKEVFDFKSEVNRRPTISNYISTLSESLQTTGRIKEPIDIRKDAATYISDWILGNKNNKSTGTTFENSSNGADINIQSVVSSIAQFGKQTTSSVLSQYLGNNSKINKNDSEIKSDISDLESCYSCDDDSENENENDKKELFYQNKLIDEYKSFGHYLCKLNQRFLNDYIASISTRANYLAENILDKNKKDYTNNNKKDIHSGSDDIKLKSLNEEQSLDNRHNEDVIHDVNKNMKTEDNMIEKALSFGDYRGCYSMNIDIIAESIEWFQRLELMGSRYLELKKITKHSKIADELSLGKEYIFEDIKGRIDFLEDRIGISSLETLTRLTNGKEIKSIQTLNHTLTIMVQEPNVNIK